MDISIKLLKEELIKTIVPLYVGDGFSFNKSSFSFSKKINKTRIKSQFMFYDYAPRKVEFSFNFTFQLGEIVEEEKRFDRFCGTEYKSHITVLLREGDYHPLVKNEILKFRGSFTHVVSDIEQDKIVFEDCKTVLLNEFFPRVNTFSNLASFQNFILQDFKKVIDFKFEYSALIAMKLKSHEDFLNLVNYLTAELKLNEKDDIHVDKQRINKFLAFENADRIKV